MSWTQSLTPRSPKTLSSEGYVVETQDFGPIHYVPAQNAMNPDAANPDYVPERVSCITPGNEFVILPLPVAMRRIQLQKQQPWQSLPQVLTPWGLTSVEDYQRELLRDPSVLSLPLEAHPLVPTRLVRGQRAVDVEGLLGMNSNILAHKTTVKVLPADRPCQKPMRAFGNTWIGRWLRCARQTPATGKNAAHSEMNQEEVMVLYPEYQTQVSA